MLSATTNTTAKLWKPFDLSGSPKSNLDCTFSSSSSTFCRWNIDVRDHSGVWRVLHMDRWTGESACMAPFSSDSGQASAKLWSPFVGSGDRCVRFAFRTEGKSRLNVLRHSKGWGVVIELRYCIFLIRRDTERKMVTFAFLFVGFTFKLLDSSSLIGSYKKITIRYWQNL